TLCRRSSRRGVSAALSSLRVSVSLRLAVGCCALMSAPDAVAVVGEGVLLCGRGVVAVGAGVGIAAMPVVEGIVAGGGVVVRRGRVAGRRRVVRVRRAIIGRRGVGGSACFGVPGASHAVVGHWLVGLRGVDGVDGPVAGRVTGPGGFAGGVVIAIAVVVADVAALGHGPGVRRFRVVGGEVGGVAVLRVVGAG